MLSEIKKYIGIYGPKTGFFRDVGILAGGSAIAYALPMLATPLLTRLYSPEDFGVLAVYLALISVIVSIASLRYELAIPLAEEHQEATSLVYLSLLFILCTVGVTSLVVAFWSENLLALFNTPALHKYSWLLPLGVLLSGLFTITSFWSTRIKAFSHVAVTKIKQSTGMLFVQLLSFKVDGGLILGRIVGSGIGIATLGNLMIGHIGFASFNWKRIKLVAFKYSYLPKYSSWSALLNASGNALMPLAFSVIFGPSLAGIYFLAHMLLSIPISLIGQSVGQVFLSHAGEASRDGSLSNLIEKTQRQLCEVGILPLLILLFFGPELFSIIFGDEWYQSGEIAFFMAPWLFLVFILSPFSTVFTVLKKEHAGLVFQVILNTSRVLVVFWSATLNDFMLAVVAFSYVSAICWLGYLVYLFQLTKLSIAKFLNYFMRISLYPIFLVSPLILPLSIDPIFPITLIKVLYLVFITVIYYRFVFKSKKK